MTDRFDSNTRSRIMASIKNKNTGLELRIRSALHRKGLRFRLHPANLPGRPDIVMCQWQVLNNSDIKPLDAVERFFANTNITIQHGGSSAFYSPARDLVQMPELQTFRDRESFYAVLAHEMTHATRHESRLDRDLGRKRFGDAGYAMEELCAEIGAAFLCADLGITPETRDDHAAYIQSWLKVLKDDQRAIFTAASHAQKAADFLHGLQPNAADTAPAEDRQEAA
jgi:antirestriction protein ArdC